MVRRSWYPWCILLLVLAAWGRAPAEQAASISPAQTEEHGFLIHTVESEYQAGRTTIRVLLPHRLEKAAPYRVLYVLPVEAKDGDRYGDGLLECKKLGLPDKYRLICVAPTFSDLPWYADHPGNPRIRQESYFVRVVVPFVDRAYPVAAQPEGRWLLGFSKSGWGAFSLLLRHPDVFGKAAAWDAPLMQERPDRFGMGPIFATEENFAHYRIANLLRQQAGQFQGAARLIHFGYGNFRQHHQRAHALMRQLGIAQVYRDGPQRRHDWSSGWLAEAVEMLAREPPGKQ